MLFYLFLLFTLVPLAEVVVLVNIGQATEWWVPILLVIGTGILGAALARWQGWHAIERIRADARSGRVPTAAIIDGVLIFIAGLLLISPGVITDLLGVALLIPPLRAIVKRGVTAWLRHSFEVRLSRASTGPWPTTGGARAQYGDEIIEAKVLKTHVEDIE